MGARDILARLADDGITLRADAGRLLVRPVEKVTDEILTRLRASKSELLALLTPPPSNKTEEEPWGYPQELHGFPLQVQRTRSCHDCLHRLRAGTCAQPEAAGLTPAGQGFGIALAPQGHAAICAAFTSKAPGKATDRPYRLSAAEGDAAHATAWDDASVSLFIRRTERLQRQGFRDSDAEDLAERLHLRDVQQDGRALCLECRYLTGTTATAWRCGNHKTASVPHNLAGDLVTLLQRCPAFSRGSA